MSLSSAKQAELLNKSLARQRWARVAWVYGAMLIIGVIFVGVFYVSFITSLKTNPLEWPFKFTTAQMNPQNWVDSSSLGRQGANNGWLGGFAEGADVTFNLSYFVPDDEELVLPEVVIPKRDPGSRLGALKPAEFAADFSTFELTQLGQREGSLTVRDELVTGSIVDYSLNVKYVSELV